MTHISSHVIIDLARAPIAEGSKIKVWHCGVALLAIGFALGALLF